MNFLINAGLWFAGVCVLGWLVSMRWFRAFILQISSKIPVLSTLTNFLLSHDYIEQIKSGELTMMPEVLLSLANDDWTFGIVVKKLKLPEHPEQKDSPLVDWCVILAPPTPPLSFTSQIRLRKESTVVYTGRQGKETTLTVATFGLNFVLDPKKFSVKKPQP